MHRVGVHPPDKMRKHGPGSTSSAPTTAVPVAAYLVVSTEGAVAVSLTVSPAMDQVPEALPSAVATGTTGTTLQLQAASEEAASRAAPGASRPPPSFEECAWRVVIVRQAAKQLAALGGRDCEAALSKLYTLAEGYWQDCTVAKKLVSHAARSTLSLYE